MGNQSAFFMASLPVARYRVGNLERLIHGIGPSLMRFAGCSRANLFVGYLISSPEPTGLDSASAETARQQPHRTVAGDGDGTTSLRQGHW